MAQPKTVSALGTWLDQEPSGQEFWEKVHKTKPLIQERADVVIRELAYDPSVLTAVVWPSKIGEATWEVRYWATPPKDYAETVMSPGDLQVFLNTRGEILWVLDHKSGEEQVIYGKDLRINKGMTQQQVLERLGQPDYKGPPPRHMRRSGHHDEFWLYKKRGIRTTRYDIYFDNRKVSFVSFSLEE